MPHLFSPYVLKDVTLRNRIVMSPMTMYRSVDGCMTDFHVMLMGSRAAGGFGLVFPEQIAIRPDGRTSVSCAGIWDDAQIVSLARVTRIIKDMGADVTPTFHPAATRDRPVLSRMSAVEATGGFKPARCFSSSAAKAAGVA